MPTAKPTTKRFVKCVHGLYMQQFCPMCDAEDGEAAFHPPESSRPSPPSPAPQPPSVP